jgi:hypothetical protein
MLHMGGTESTSPTRDPDLAKRRMQWELARRIGRSQAVTRAQ